MSGEIHNKPGGQIQSQPQQLLPQGKSKSEQGKSKSEPPDRRSVQPENVNRGRSNNSNINHGDTLQAYENNGPFVKIVTPDVKTVTSDKVNPNPPQQISNREAVEAILLLDPSSTEPSRFSRVKEILANCAYVARLVCSWAIAKVTGAATKSLDNFDRKAMKRFCKNDMTHDESIEFLQELGKIQLSEKAKARLTASEGFKAYRINCRVFSDVWTKANKTFHLARQSDETLRFMEVAAPFDKTIEDDLAYLKIDRRLDKKLDDICKGNMSKHEAISFLKTVGYNGITEEHRMRLRCTEFYKSIRGDANALCIIYATSVLNDPGYMLPDQDLELVGLVAPFDLIIRKHFIHMYGADALFRSTMDKYDSINMMNEVNKKNPPQYIRDQIRNTFGFAQLHKEAQKIVESFSNKLESGIFSPPSQDERRLLTALSHFDESLKTELASIDTEIQKHRQ